MSGRIRDGAVAGFALAQVRLGAAAFDGLADLAADVGEHLEEASSGPDFAAKKLHDTEKIVPQLNGKGEGAVQAQPGGERSAGEVGFLGYIWNPGRAALEPDAPWQAFADGEGELLDGILEIRSVKTGLAPEIDEAQEGAVTRQAAPISHPRLSQMAWTIFGWLSSRGMLSARMAVTAIERPDDLSARFAFGDVAVIPDAPIENAVAAFAGRCSC